VSEVPLGGATIPLSSVPSTGNFDQWVPLHQIGRMESVSGEVRCNLTSLF